ncbi:hypothetical protein AGMMS49525_05890 [Bacteroidia bacterium]|nr:hypothetical protein AGMMS49525_05890 [Bacteroidia bacterium]
MNRYKNFMVTLLLVGQIALCPYVANAQVSIGSGAAPRQGAMLDLNTTSMGLVLPNISLSSDLTKYVLGEGGTAPANGMLVYNSNAGVADGKGVYVWSGTAWKKVTVLPSSVELSLSEIQYTKVGQQPNPLGMVVKPDQVVNKNVTWSSSVPSVATVDADGYVTTLTNGNTTITATTVVGAKTSSISVTVKIVPVSLSLNTNSATYTTIGDQTPLIATLTPVGKVHPSNATVSWWSSNPEIVTVDANGKPTTVNSGQAYIYVASDVNGSLKDSCEVTVNIPVTGISSITPGTAILTAANESLILKANVVPAGATDQAIVWSSNNASVASVDADTGVVTAHTTGTVTITAKAHGNTAQTATRSVTVNIP